MTTIFGNFRQKCTFSLKNNVAIKFLHKLAVFLSQTRRFLACFVAI
jgi:hypothetical protein